MFKVSFHSVKDLRHTNGNTNPGVKYVSGIRCDNFMFLLQKIVRVNITVLALLDTR
jgi:hypothetical protein